MCVVYLDPRQLGYCREGSQAVLRVISAGRGLDDAVLAEERLELRRIHAAKLNAGPIERVFGVARVLHDDPHDSGLARQAAVIVREHELHGMVGANGTRRQHLGASRGQIHQSARGAVDRDIDVLLDLDATGRPFRRMRRGLLGPGRLLLRRRRRT